MPKIVQWVNLPKVGDFPDENGETIPLARRGAVELDVEFDDSHPSVPYRYSAHWKPNLYEFKEKQRNPHFRTRFVKGGDASGDEQTVRPGQGVVLSAAGGVEYEVRAVAEGKEVASSKRVIAKRRLYYRSVAMPKCGEKADAILGKIKDYLAKDENELFVDLVHVEATAEPSIPGGKVIFSDKEGNSNEEPVLSAIEDNHAFGSTMNPYGFVVAWVQYIAELVEKQLDQGAPRKGNPFGQVAHQDPKRRWTWNAATKTLRVNVGGALWHGFLKKDDDAKAWFKWSICLLECSDGTEVRVEVNRDQVSLAGEPIGSEGGYSEIEIDLSSKLDGKTVKGIAFKVQVNLAELSAGQTLPLEDGLTLIMISTKGNWKPALAKEMELTLLHEIGHFLGMVADGKKRRPDLPGFYYVGLGHDGPHCMNGMVPDGKGGWSGTAKCVMFGDAHGGQPPAFCDVCAPVVRKLDLGPPEMADTK